MKQAAVLIEQTLKVYLGTKELDTFRVDVRKETIDWSAIIQITYKHKLQPILHKVLKEVEEEAIPIIPQLRRYRMLQMRRSLFKLKELQRTTAAFDAAGIRITPYKGMAFAQCFYGDITLRASVDIDMAIALSDIPASFAIMRALGYVEYSKEKVGASSETEVLENARAYHIDYPWVLYEGAKIICNIEFHWQPSHPVLQVPLTFVDLPADAYTNIQIGGQGISTFTKPYLALFTLIHHGLIDTWGQYRHLLDFAMIMKCLTKKESISFKKLLEKYQLQQCFYMGLYLLEQLFELPVSTIGYQAKNHRKLGTQLMAALHDDRLAGKWSENPRKLLYHLRMRDTLGQRVRTVGSLIWFKIRFS